MSFLGHEHHSISATRRAPEARCCTYLKDMRELGTPEARVGEVEAALAGNKLRIVRVANASLASGEEDAAGELLRRCAGARRNDVLSATQRCTLHLPSAIVRPMGNGDGMARGARRASEERGG